MLGSRSGAQGSPDWLWHTPHARQINAVSVLGNSNRFVTGSFDQTVKVWSRGTSNPISTWAGFIQDVYDVASSPDGSLVGVATGSFHRIFDATTGNLLYQRAHGSSPARIAFADHQPWYAVAQSDGTVGVFSTSLSFLFWAQPGGSGWAKSLSFTEDGNKLLVLLDSNLHVWDVPSRTRTALNALGSSPQIVQSLPQSSECLVGFESNQLSVVNSTTGQVLRTLIPSGAGDRSIRDIASHPATDRVYAATENGTVIGYDLATLTEQWRIETGAAIYSIDLSEDGATLMLTDGSYVVEFDTVTQTITRAYGDHRGTIVGSTFVSDGSAVRFASVEGLLRTRALPSSDLLRERVQAGIARHERSPDGSRYCSGKNTIQVFDSLTEQPVGQFTPPAFGLNALSFSPNNQEIAVNANSGQIYLYDVATGQVLRQWWAHSQTIVGLEYDASGQMLYSASGDPNVRAWRKSDASLVREYPSPGGAAKSVALSPTQPLVAVGGFGGVRIYDTDTGALVRTVYALAAVHGLEFSSDGQSLFVLDNLTMSSDYYYQNGITYGGAFLRVVDVASGSEVAQLHRGLQNLNGLTLSDDEQYISVFGPCYGVFRNPLLFDADPRALAVTLGRLSSGDVSSVIGRDDGNAAAVSLDTRTRGSNRVQVEVDSILPVLAPRKLKVSVRARTTATGLQARIQMLDRGLNQWVTVSSGHLLDASYHDVVVEVPGPISRFIGSGGEIKARYQVYGLATQVKQIGNVFVDWFHLSGSR